MSTSELSIPLLTPKIADLSFNEDFRKLTNFSFSDRAIKKILTYQLINYPLNFYLTDYFVNRKRSKIKSFFNSVYGSFHHVAE